MSPAWKATVTGLGIIAADQATKVLIAHPSGTIENEGTLLGLLPVSGRLITLMVTLPVLLAATGWAWSLVRVGHVPAIVTAIPLGGAASNAVDRFIHGAVMDWLTIGDVVVNLADIAIVVGAVAFTMSAIRHPRRKRRLRPDHVDGHAKPLNSIAK